MLIRLIAPRGPLAMISAEKNTHVPDGILKEHFQEKQSFFSWDRRTFFSFSLVRRAVRDRPPKFMTLTASPHGALVSWE